MKKIFKSKSKVLTLCGIFICSVLTVALSISLFSAITSAQNKEHYPEPDVRPNIREDAVWDSELGMYVSGDYIKKADGTYELKSDIFVSDKATSPEEEWLISHSNSKNEIDMAIMYSLELSSKEPPTLLSAISPRSSDAILTAMSTLSVSSYPEVWERVCLEPAYRAQKIVALEMFLDVSFDDLGLYDSWAQHEWYNSFNKLKNELKDNVSRKQITDKEVEQYGNLLLPLLMQKAKDKTILETELNVLEGLIKNISAQLNTDHNTPSIKTSKDAVDWFDEHMQLVDAIDKIIESNYEWVE